MRERLCECHATYGRKLADLHTRFVLRKHQGKVAIIINVDVEEFSLGSEGNGFGAACEYARITLIEQAEQLIVRIR